jgi:cold shock CspA family protein
METEKKSHGGKRSAILAHWDEVRGFGFCQARNPDGTKKSWFLHCTRIARVEDPEGIIRGGERVLFNEEPSAKGLMAIDVEILSSNSILVGNTGGDR